MLIVSGKLYLKAGAMKEFLASSNEAVALARSAPGCRDFVVAPDPIEPDRVNVYEEWESEKSLLDFIGLADFAEMPAGELSIGQRRLLALGRAMAMNPVLLMLDEPAAGLSPVNVNKLLETVLALKARHGLTVILVEHVMKLVMASCDVVTVLDHGEKIAEGPPDAIRDDYRVIEAYLGKEMKDAEVRAFLRSP